METTFITIHDLSPHATILYCSDSIVDILGYSPQDVLQKSSWEYFHPDEIPLARAKHDRSVELDKAAVLSYCRLRHVDGSWLGCEVIFTVVYDVLVGCTSIYKTGTRSENRAAEAPIVRRIFSPTILDPRYDMLSHLSPKFSTSSKAYAHENRAALFLNRYTRTLTIMYATDGLSHVLGMTGEEMRGRSFYYCIQDSCLSDAIRCLEHAKGNDSIAYLRFWFRDPRQEDSEPDRSRMDVDSDASSGMHEGARSQTGSGRYSSVESQALSSTDSGDNLDFADGIQTRDSKATRASSSNSNTYYTHEAVFGEAAEQSSSASSVPQSPQVDYAGYSSWPRSSTNERGEIELEAVISCTSDGLVVCLRAARQYSSQVNASDQFVQAGGVFAAPWSSQPIIPTPSPRPQYAHGSAFSPGARSAELLKRQAGPPEHTNSADFMSAIRECAIFAWAVTGINGALADYSQGTPRGEAQPSSGLPVWRSEPETLEGDNSLVPRTIGIGKNDKNLSGANTSS